MGEDFASLHESGREGGDGRSEEGLRLKTRAGLRYIRVAVESAGLRKAQLVSTSFQLFFFLLFFLV